MEILRVENICKTYEMDNAPVHALSDISFSVDKGEFVAIIGAYGRMQMLRWYLPFKRMRNLL